ncbi:major facilitator superfamily domain-containing protein [Xylaria acuta]|nr:major facilitator superfamily domain-containing protein [Xylaria acuta]
MEGNPNVPAGTNNPNEDPVGDSTRYVGKSVFYILLDIVNNRLGHRESQLGDSTQVIENGRFGDLPKAKAVESSGGDGTGGRGQSDEHSQDGGNDQNGEHNSSGTTTLTNSQDPLEASFVTAPDLAQADGARDAEKEPGMEEDGRRELLEEDCENELGYAFSTSKKWWILGVIFLVQTSMNFNTSLYSNGIVGIAQEFHVTDQVARAGAALFLITYAFGCELWAPWSEEFGRKLILQLSLLLTNLWTIPVGLAPNIGTVLVGRALGGLSTAGGSVTLGMIADMYDSDSQQYAVAFVVFSSVIGSILGPIVGGFVELLPSDQAWRWCTWIQLIFGVFVQLLHALTVPETRTTILMDVIAKKRRQTNEDPNVYGPGEMHPFKDRFTFRELMETWSRAFKMLITEPIVRILSLLSGASDAMVFIQIQSMNLVYKQWNFNSWQIGLAFVPIAVGYFIAWMIFIPIFKHGQRRREEKPHDEHAQFESRLYPMLYLSLCLPLGLGIFGAGSMGPRLHWSISMVGTCLIGVANYSIYMATIDYMVCAYGPYSASATGGNGLARDFLAGALTPAAIPFYTTVGPNKSSSLMWGSFFLCVVSMVLVAFSCRVYRNGALYRRHSPFAQQLSLGHEGIRGPPRPPSPPDQPAPEPPPIQVTAPTVWDGLFSRQPKGPPRQPSFGPTSPRGAYMASVHAASRRQSRQNSRNPSANPSRRNSQEGQEAAVPLGLLGALNFQEQPRIEEQRIEEQPIEEQPIEEQPVEEQPVDEQPINEQHISEQPSGHDSLSDVVSLDYTREIPPRASGQTSPDWWRDDEDVAEAQSSDEQSFYGSGSDDYPESNPDEHPEHPEHSDDRPHAEPNATDVEGVSSGPPLNRDMVERMLALAG